MPLTTGQVVNNRYRIIRLLGQGGFGAVYQAWDNNLDRACALKENLDTSGEVSRQFEREARLLANLTHRNLPRVIDHFILPEQGQYLVMDYIEGDDLEARLRKNGRPLEVNQALDWVGQVCEALAYLHRHDPPIIHRDIKPANIRITPQGQAVLVDFGIAKLYHPSMPTTIGARAVTSGYSPPEQYGRGATDARSDIYALGATLYYLLTGQTPPDSIDRMTQAVPPLQPVHGFNPGVPLAVSQAISQAMSIDREARFSSIEAFQRALQPISAPPMYVASTQVVVQPAISGGPGVGVYGSPSGTSRAAAPQSVVYPTSRPRTSPQSDGPAKTMAMVGAGALILFGLAAAVVAGVLLYNWWNGAAATGQPTPTVLGGLVTPGEPTFVVVTATDAPTELASSATPVATEPPAPTDTPLSPTPIGARVAALPGSRIAFVSDHLGNGTDQIFVREVRAGEYLFAPQANGVYQFDPGMTSAAVGSSVQLPLGANYNIAWWPEWCDGNRTILYEGQDTNYGAPQILFQVAVNALEAGAQPIQWGSADAIGVPRCANHSNRAIASGRLADRSSVWLLNTFSLDNPGAPSPISADGFSGFASWAADDRWFAFMRRQGGGSWVLMRQSLDTPGDANRLTLSDPARAAKYPALSPVADWLAYACSNSNEWDLCVQAVTGEGFSVLRAGLGSEQDTARANDLAVHAVTPHWSPDGRWLAFSSNEDGDWDVYLYNLDTEVVFNLTTDLDFPTPSNQFQPAWSKP